jgi:hypothetical protein
MAWMAGLTLALGSMAMAQDDNANISVGYDLEVKMGHQLEFESAIQEQLSWYRQNNETWHWHCWAWVTGENSGGYVFRSPGHTLADFDARAERTTRARNNFLKKVGPHLESMRGVMGATMPNISHWPDDLGEVPMVSVYWFNLNYGMSDKFENAIARIHEAIQEAEWGLNYSWGTTISGGEMPTYTLVIPHKNFQGMAPPPKPFWKMMDETVGRAESDALRAALQECVRKERSALAKFRPELSYMPDN